MPDIIVHISTMISSKHRAICTKRNANWFALHLSKIAILTLQIASKGCNFNVNIYSITRAGSRYAIWIFFIFFIFLFKQNCLNWSKICQDIIVHISTMISCKCCAICTKCNANWFALHLSKKAIYSLVIASKGCNYVCHAI